MLSRDLQYKLLKEYAELYPSTASFTPNHQGYTQAEVMANLFYLWEHALIETKWHTPIRGAPVPGAIRASAKGMDFLQDDGGLSAILGTITVRLDDQTIRALLIAKVEGTAAEPTAKQALIAAIRALPAESLKQVAENALDAGLQTLPATLEQLRAWIGL